MCTVQYEGLKNTPQLEDNFVIEYALSVQPKDVFSMRFFKNQLFGLKLRSYSELYSNGVIKNGTAMSTLDFRLVEYRGRVSIWILFHYLFRKRIPCHRKRSSPLPLREDDLGIIQ